MKFFIASLILLFLILGLSWRLMENDAHKEEVNSAVSDRKISTDHQWDDLFNPTLEMTTRLAKVKSLDRSFTLEILLPHLSKISPHQVPRGDDETNFVIFNEILTAFRKKNLGSEDLLTFLLDLFHDAKKHSVIRDYAVQHLIIMVKEDHSLSSEIISSLCDGLADPQIQQTEIPGTFFNAINHLRHSSPALLVSFEKNLTITLLQLLEQPHLIVPTKVSLVYSLKGQTQSVESRKAAREIVKLLIQNPKTHEAILIAAASTLGSIGTQEDVPLLEELAHRGTLATVAAQKSISKLNL